MARPKSDRSNRLLMLGVLLKNVPKLLKLVWQAAAGWLIINLILTLAGALIPVGQLYVTKLVVDRIILNITNTGLDILPIFMLAGLGLGLALAQEALQQGNSFISQVLSDRFTLYANGIL